MRPRRRSTPEDDRLVRDANADPLLRSMAITAVAIDHIEELEPEIAACLDHSAWTLREEAILALVHFWERDAYVSRAMEMLASDPNENVRAGAARSLGTYVLRVGKRRNEIIRALVRSLEGDTEKIVVRIVFDALEDLLPGVLPRIDTSLLSPDELRSRIEWTALASFRSH